MIKTDGPYPRNYLQRIMQRYWAIEFWKSTFRWNWPCKGVYDAILEKAVSSNYHQIIEESPQWVEVGIGMGFRWGHWLKILLQTGHTYICLLRWHVPLLKPWKFPFLGSFISLGIMEFSCIECLCRFLYLSTYFITFYIASEAGSICSRTKLITTFMP